MKVYIVTDMEGVSGIVRWEQARVGTPDYHAALPLLVGEINAAVEGAFAGGASEVLVNDGHDGGYNLTYVYRDLDPRAAYLTGAPRPQMLCGLDATYDAPMMVGYHPIAGTSDGNLAHTQSSETVARYWLNGEPIGEIGQMAVIAGHCRVPAVLSAVEGRQRQRQRRCCDKSRPRPSSGIRARRARSVSRTPRRATRSALAPSGLCAWWARPSPMSCSPQSRCGSRAGASPMPTPMPRGAYGGSTGSPLRRRSTARWTSGASRRRGTKNPLSQATSGRRGRVPVWITQCVASPAGTSAGPRLYPGHDSVILTEISVSAGA